MRRWIVGLALWLVLVPGLASAQSPLASPPEQPATGPGGAAGTYPAVVREQHGDGADAYWLIEPAAADGTPVLDQHLPLIVFIHGMFATDPFTYGAWLDHLAQRGAVVIFPVYQVNRGLRFEPDRYLPRVEASVRSAVDGLERASSNAIDLTRVAVVGHSTGGWMAVQYARAASGQGLPVPQVVLSLMPGGCSGCGALAQLVEMPASLDGAWDPATLALLVTIDPDPVVGAGASDRVWQAMSELPAEQRNRLVMVTDDHGAPPLIVDHNVSQTFGPGQPNASDWYGPWKLLDAAMSCRFMRTDCDVAIGGSAAQTSMGTWGDGTPVAPMGVVG